MKDLSFSEGYTTGAFRAAQNAGKHFMIFDWDKAAKILANDAGIKSAEAGLQGDFPSTGGVIFEHGKPDTNSYVYLKSNWAIPVMRITRNGKEDDIPCFITSENNPQNWHQNTKWPESALKILKTKA